MIPPGVVPKPPVVPTVLVSPTGVVMKNPKAPVSAAPSGVALTTRSPLKSALDFLKKPAGPLPVYGWGLIGFGVTGSLVALVAAVWKKY